MEPTPATTLDIAKTMALYAEELAEAIGLIAHAIAAHSSNPDGLIEDLTAISEPDAENSPPIALFFRRFNAVMKGGIESTAH